MTEYSCEPIVVNVIKHFDCYDDTGKMETYDEHVYNCEGCWADDCPHWKEYNEV